MCVRVFPEETFSLTLKCVFFGGPEYHDEVKIYFVVASSLAEPKYQFQILLCSGRHYNSKTGLCSSLQIFQCKLGGVLCCSRIE